VIFYDFLENNINEFNFEHTLLTLITDALEKRNNLDKKTIKLIVQQIEKDVLLNLMDPFYRFIIKQHFAKFKEKQKSLYANSSINVIMQKTPFIFNNFEQFSTIFDQKDPILLSQILLQKLLSYTKNFLEYKKKVDFNPTENHHYFIIKELTLELQVVKLEELTNIQKISFYINTFNSLMLQSGYELYGIELFKNKEEFEMFYNIMAYVIDGKVYSLRRLKEIILELYMEITYSEKNMSNLIVNMSLILPTENSKQKIFPLIPQMFLINQIIKLSKINLVENIKFEYGRISIPKLYFKEMEKEKTLNKKYHYDMMINVKNRDLRRKIETLNNKRRDIDRDDNELRKIFLIKENIVGGSPQKTDSNNDSDIEEFSFEENESSKDVTPIVENEIKSLERKVEKKLGKQIVNNRRVQFREFINRDIVIFRELRFILHVI
jgi:hypothetical protein